MAVLNVNPAAEAGSEFPVFQPGTYHMRVKEVTDRSIDPSNPKQDFKVVLEYVDPSALILVNGQPYEGKADAAGSLFDYIMQAPDKQWKLRQISDAAGLQWVDQDFTQTLVGQELDVKVKIEEYQGEQKNKVSRYLAVK
jgi:hypothetical protein